MNIEQQRAAFEARFPMPADCQWCGTGYAPTEFNAWDAQAYANKWEGFKAALELDRQGRGEPVAWHTEDHLTDKSATTYDPIVAERWIEKGWPVSPLFHAPQPAAPVVKDSLTVAEPVAWGIFYQGVMQQGWGYNEEAARAIADEDYPDLVVDVKPLFIPEAQPAQPAAITEPDVVLREERYKGFSAGWDRGHKHGSDQGFSLGVCAALAVVKSHDSGTIWREIVTACGQQDLLHFVAHEEPDEWEIAGFDKYAKVELGRGKPSKRKAHPAPVAAQRENDEDAYVIERMGKLLAEIAVIVRGPELPCHRHGYSDLPERVAALKVAAQPSVPPVPDGYVIKRVDGHGWIVYPRSGYKWTAHDRSPIGDFFDAFMSHTTPAAGPSSAVKCDGNHGGPRCADPDCWNDTPIAVHPASGEDAKSWQRLNRIAWLIGSMFVHGDFMAETANERELETLLRDNGTFWNTLADFDAAMQQGGQS